MLLRVLSLHPTPRRLSSRAAVPLGLLLALTACGPRDPSEQNNTPPPVDMADMLDMQDMADAGDMTDMQDMTEAPPYTAHVHLTVYQPERGFPYAEVALRGSFSPKLARLDAVDPLGALATTRGWSLGPHAVTDALPALTPDAMMPDTTDAAVSAPEPSDSRDAGPALRVGDALSAPLRALPRDMLGWSLYASEAEDATSALDDALREELRAPMALAYDGGEVPAGRAEGAVVVPAPITLTSCDPLQELPLRQDVPLVLSWAPTLDPDDTILIRATTTDGAWRLWRVDDGRAIFDLGASMRAEGMTPGDGMAITITRRLERPVQVGAELVRVVTSRSQRLFARVVRPVEVTPDVWLAGQLTEVRVASWDRPFDGGAVTLNAGAEPALRQIAGHLADCQDQIASFTVHPSADTRSRPLDLRISGAPGEATRHIPDAVWLAEPLELAGDCASAVDEGFLAIDDGVFLASDRGVPPATFRTDTCAATLTGRAQAIPLRLLAGQTLRAVQRRDAARGGMYLARSCADDQPVRACSVAALPGGEHTLRYVAQEDEDVLLVITSDAASDAPAARYAVAITRTTTALNVSPDTLHAGQSAQLTIYSTAGDLTGATFDLGPEVTVERATVDGARATLDVRVAADAKEPHPTLRVTRAGSALETRDALHLLPARTGQKTCAAADAAPITASGSFWIDASALSDADHNALTQCGDRETPAGEVTVRVELPASHILRASVTGSPGAALHLRRACDEAPTTCAGPDDDQPTLTSLEWIGPPQPTTVYLTVDHTTRAPTQPAALHIALDAR